MTVKLSVVLITRNEAHNIAACLDSLSFADEIVIVDANSQDTTAAIASRCGAKVIVTDDWPGFGPQKNRALAESTGEWILSIDADERVSAALRTAILRAIAEPSADVYAMRRISNYCGYWIRHGAWANDWVARLFRRSSAQFSLDRVHEKLLYDCPDAHLSGELLHYSYRNFEESLEKLNRYSTLTAEQRFAAGRRSSLWGAHMRAKASFVKSYLLQAGFLDGAGGWLVARYQAESCFYRHAKLWQLARQVSLSEPEA